MFFKYKSMSNFTKLKTKHLFCVNGTTMGIETVIYINFWKFNVNLKHRYEWKRIG